MTAENGSLRGWSPFSWWNRINPQCPLTQTCPLIVNFPPELRIWICSYLNERDRRSMKQVCKHFEIDLNYIYGVDAVLCGPKLMNQLSGTKKAEIFLFGNAAETKQIEENVNWIKNVLPQNLELRRFSGLDFDTRNLVIVPDFVLSLAIELDQRQPEFVLERLKETLAYYQNLKRLSLTCHAVQPMTENGPFNAFGTNVANNLLVSLEFKPHLSELSVSVTIQKLIGWTINLVIRDFDAYFGQMIVPPNVAATELWLQNPPKPTRIEINIPDLPTDNLRCWKMFLDAQDRLIHLKLNFGYIYWNFFRTVLRTNAPTLKTLDLVLMNWYPELDNLGVPALLKGFDWNIILPAANKLETLRISTALNFSELFELMNYAHAWPNNTLNFYVMVSMISLQELVLLGVYLNQFQLRIIFTELQSLQNVELTAWTRTGEVAFVRTPTAYEYDCWGYEEHLGIFGKEDYMGRLQNLCELLNEVLLQRQMQSIKLIDMSLWFCVEVNRYNFLKKLTKSFYTITWPEPSWISHPSDFDLYPLIMKLN